MAVSILALDLASNTGWCWGRVGAVELPRLGSVSLAVGRTSVGARGCHLVDWLDDHVQIFEPDLICFEAPLPRGQHSGIQAGRIALGLAMACEMFCYRRNIPCREGNVNQARKAVLGAGNAKKDAVFAACVAAGLSPIDEDASDAWLLWRFAVIKKGIMG